MYTPAAAAPTTARSSCNMCPPGCSPRLFRTRCIVRASLYDLLGVTTSASTAEIRTAYRRLAARYHPDVNSSLVAHEKFQALNMAAEVLTTSELRQQYDARGTAALPSSRYHFLLDFLRQARAQGVSCVLGEPGGDLSTVLGLDFNEAVTGSAATVTMDVLGPCGDCKGSGFEATSQMSNCSVCKGTGEIMVRHWNPEGGATSGSSSSSLLALPRNCPACRGSGKSEQQDCNRCEGQGRVQLRRKVRFRVPGGVVDGQVLRLKGQGHSGKYGGAPGDLLVKLQVYDLGDVRRQGYDLYSVLELPLYEALLGGSVAVKTVRGQRNILVPAGTQHGQVLCVQGAGVPRPGSSVVQYGHHYFEVAVRVPSAAAVSQTELQLLQQLAATVLRSRPRPGPNHQHQHQQQIRQQKQQQQHCAADVEQLQDTARQTGGAGAYNDQLGEQQRFEQNNAQAHNTQQQQQQQPAAAGLSGQHSSDPPLGSIV